MTVYLVGAGPGDPDLLTLRGAEVLASAEVVVYDRLSVSSLLDLAPPDAERISVGKQPGGPRTSQDDINALLVARGQAGQQVVRLKGGDPFVFARGGEEAAALAAAGVAFEVVPGITSAVAVPAYAGIPVTMRYSSTSFTVVTGHEDPAKGEGSVNWEAVAALGGTVVVLMGAARCRPICERLIAAGMAPDTPAAAVQWGTRPNQRTLRATLATLADLDPQPPATIVVGEVAAADLAWFENRPLFGRRIVVTRARPQAAALATELRRRGAEAVELPTIAFEAPKDLDRLVRAAAEVGRYDWVVFTSPTGVNRFFEHLRDARSLGEARVAAIGPGTAAALADRNVAADLIPEQYVAEALLEALADEVGSDWPGRVLIPRAETARDVLPEGLVAAGWDVDVVPAYRTVSPAPDPAAAALLADAEVITFTSSSTVTNFVDTYGVDAVPKVVATIGPVTSATARSRGLEVTVEATEHTVDGLITALEHFFAR
ncbi:MAG: uroporphyrinogen-III C-methyltransferase [Acidimicrobiia bacterium]|nr:uroporphyrinogen-III C-methyltransferase [Acidimicrobiia bacterium]MYB73661.1 uroporphyrinogen-III C-methyltransferase [Acidimicrobiia bacterium]MYH98184.1 uroporphyrinogen-III C-methyltransferase [Acidimicrobiia bacterium]